MKRSTNYADGNPLSAAETFVSLAHFLLETQVCGKTRPTTDKRSEMVIEDGRN